MYSIYECPEISEAVKRECMKGYWIRGYDDGSGIQQDITQLRLIYPNFEAILALYPEHNNTLMLPPP